MSDNSIHSGIHTGRDTDDAELSFCDEDIREMFHKIKSGYFTGTPLLAQLIKELRLMRQELAIMREKHDMPVVQFNQTQKHH